MRTEKWMQLNTQSLAGKRIAITGSTGGLGKEICTYLASMGATLYLLDRNEERSSAHKKSLTDRFGVDVTCIPLDLEDIVSAESAVLALMEEGVDVFIHNAGAYSIPRHICSTGYENVFQINFATPYYMIQRLLPALRERHGHVVAVGSIAHNYSKIDTDDVDFRTRSASSKVYGNAKRYLMFALHELFREEKDVTLSIVHPGITFTNITAHYPKWIFAIIKHPMKFIFMKPSRAALWVIKGVFSPTEYNTWIGPRWFHVWGLPVKRRLRTCNEEERGRIAHNAHQVLDRCCHAVTADK